MLPSTPESGLTFAVFEMLLSGIIGLVYAFLLFRAGRAGRTRTLYFLTAAFLCYSASFFCEVVLSLRALLGWSAFLSDAHVSAVMDGLRTAALLCFVFAYQPGRVFQMNALIPATVVGVAILLVPACPLQPYLPLPQSTVRGGLDLLLLLAAGGFYLARHGIREWFAASPLLAVFLTELVRLEIPLTRVSRSTEELFELTGLVLFALVLDRKSQDLYMQVFLRLNVIFVLLASGLILTVTETERRHYLSFAELNVEELSEFLRGHVLYFWKQGQSAEQIVSSTEITRKIVSEFGRVPSLRRVRIIVDNTRMEMMIAPDGTVDQQVTPLASTPAAAEPRSTIEKRVATLVRLPIVSQQRILGQIEIDESLEGINARIASQMLTVFLSFTVLAVVSGVLIGSTVHGANRTIRRQYKELESTQEQLLHAAKLASVGQLADGVAHEINNPAGIILARTDYLASVIRERDGFSDIRDDIDVIRRQARRISEIVGGLLTFSRPSKLQIRQIDLNKLVTECLHLLEPRLYAKGIEVRLDPSQALPLIHGDPDRLEQVLINILNNAIEAMPEGGRVSIQTLQRSDGKASVRISDTGGGISKEHLKRIFDPFFTTKQKHRGTGLGLSISYGIVRDHGGTVEASSSPGQGTTFEVILPSAGEKHD